MMQPKQIKANLKEAGMIKGGNLQFKSVTYEDNPLAIAASSQN